MERLMKFAALGVARIAWGGCGSGNTAASDDARPKKDRRQNPLYGIPGRLPHRTRRNRPGETMGRILNRYGVGAATVDRLDRAAKTDFLLDGIRAGNPYTVFIHEDSLNTPASGLSGLRTQRIPIRRFSVSTASIRSASRSAKTRQRPPSEETGHDRQFAVGRHHARADALCVGRRTGKRSTNGASTSWHPESATPSRWSTTSGSSTRRPSASGRLGRQIHPCRQDYYAIPFRQNNRIQYWDVNGGSLRKQLLKAPLKYSRISSRFSNARLHPIYKVYRPHHGVDYAAPKGTPVRAVADGVVTFKGWGGGGGNTLKIKHPGNMMSGYLHLSRFAKGIAQGSRVSQGQLIGYVGSTGASTGPHLDFRLWRNGKPIDPLKAPSEPAEPIAAQNRAAFEFVRDRIVAELDGEVSDSLRITQLDSIRIGQ